MIFKRAHVEGMKAWAAYAEQQFHLAPDETISEVSALVKVQAEKIGPLAASHNRVLRAELWLEQHRATPVSACDRACGALLGSADCCCRADRGRGGSSAGFADARLLNRSRHQYDGLCTVQED